MPDLDRLTPTEKRAYDSGEWLHELRLELFRIRDSVDDAIQKISDAEEVIENRPDLTATPLTARSSDDRR
jgi:hypothetical protein